MARLKHSREAQVTILSYQSTDVGVVRLDLGVASIAETFGSGVVDCKTESLTT